MQLQNKDNSFKLFGYGVEGLINQITNNDGKVVSYENDAMKQITKIIEDLGITKIGYDSRGNTTKIKDVKGNIVGYEYGKMNELIKLLYPNDRVVEYFYNENLQS